ncbi:MAG: hypothetical protein NVSMB25_05370 [Thermoleophilaceae bacterium]
MQMNQQETIQMPAVGAEGEACERCGAPLAADQRYCLNCGHRRGPVRVPFEDHLTARERVVERELPPVRRDWTPVAALGGLGLLALVLVVGILIGKSSSKQVAAGPPQVIRLGGGSGAGTDAGGQNAAFTSDWPSGKNGYTVEIGELSKQSTQPPVVAAAKTAAQGKGAAQVGALDSDSYPSLTPGKYVIYSGVYSSKGEATAALGKLKAAFPLAKVVQVSTSATAAAASGGGGGAPAGPAPKAVQALSTAKGSDYEKQSKKLPKTVAIPGKPPPPDNQAPGGGSGGGTEIK